MAESANGLDGVVVADTRLSDVDGAGGQLVIAGHPVEDLASRASYEEVYAILVGRDSGTDARASREAIAEGRRRAWERAPQWVDAIQMSDGMAALRACVARMESDDPAALTGAVAVMAAAWARAARGLSPVAPDASRGHAEDYLRMVAGDAPAPMARAADAYFVTVVDHGMNASTFTARVIASTRSDLVSAITGAIGALKGPLHGGAPGEVLDMLDAIAEPSLARRWLAAEVAAGRRIMGMGHRIYRVRDPRAAVLEREIGRLTEAGVASSRLTLARAVEAAAEELLAERHPDRPLRANVEFYTAVLLEAIGIPRGAFTSTFAASRVAGWCAHVAEQREGGRLIRPASRYVGQRANLRAHAGVATSAAP